MDAWGPGEGEESRLKFVAGRHVFDLEISDFDRACPIARACATEPLRCKRNIGPKDFSLWRQRVDIKALENALV